MLSALSPKNDSDTLLVRVTRVWESINKRTNQLMFTNLILLDEEDNHMLATVRNNQKDIYLPLLCEGEVYSISNVKIVPGSALYRSVNRDLATGVKKMVVALWEDKATHFLELLAKESNVACFVVIIGLLAKKYSDRV
ncbi:hypothetical protein AgCh_023593, partial [Apium graveolens]